MRSRHAAKIAVKPLNAARPGFQVDVSTVRDVALGVGRLALACRSADLTRVGGGDTYDGAPAGPWRVRLTGDGLESGLAAMGRGPLALYATDCARSRGYGLLRLLPRRGPGRAGRSLSPIDPRK